MYEEGLEGCAVVGDGGDGEFRGVVGDEVDDAEASEGGEDVLEGTADSEVCWLVCFAVDDAEDLECGR